MLYGRSGMCNNAKRRGILAAEPCDAAVLFLS